MTARRSLVGFAVLVTGVALSVFVLRPVEPASACATCGCAPAKVEDAKGLLDAAKPHACPAGCTCAKCVAKAKVAETTASAKQCAAGCTKPCCAAAKKCAGASRVQCKAATAKAHDGIEMSIAAIDAAAKAVASGDKTTALAKLAEARKPLAEMHAKMEAKPAAAKAPAEPAAEAKPESAAQATPTFANSKCPIMGSKIDPSRVPASLTREFEGQTVAFCCGGCPAAWDKLPTLGKKAALARSK